MIHIGFTGTRYGMTVEQKHNVRALILALKNWQGNGIACHHGDCIGADAEFHEIARELGAHLIGHPPLDATHQANCTFHERHLPLPHMKRNRAIVDASQFMIGTPLETVEQLRGGTWSTIRMARKQKTPLATVLPSGVLLDKWPGELNLSWATMVGEQT